MLNKRAQMSEIMMWIVATIIILSILLIFVYASSLLAQKTKIIKAQDLKINLEEEVNSLDTKTLITYNLASESEKSIIDRWGVENE